jgi:hypothetical protein
MKPGKLVAALVVVALIAFLVWSTLGSQRVECRACVEYGGQRNCASASAPTREEAARSAQATACGPVARGMNESIACANRPPAELVCRGK